MVKVDVDLQIELTLEIVDHVTDVIEPDGIDFTLAHFYQDGRPLVCGRHGYRLQSCLVIQVEGTKGEMFGSGSLHRCSGLGRITADLLERKRHLLFSLLVVNARS